MITFSRWYLFDVPILWQRGTCRTWDCCGMVILFFDLSQSTIKGSGYCTLWYYRLSLLYIYSSSIIRTDTHTPAPFINFITLYIASVHYILYVSNETHHYRLNCKTIFCVAHSWRAVGGFTADRANQFDFIVNYGQIKVDTSSSNTLSQKYKR